MEYRQIETLVLIFGELKPQTCENHNHPLKWVSVPVSEQTDKWEGDRDCPAVTLISQGYRRVEINERHWE